MYDFCRYCPKLFHLFRWTIKKLGSRKRDSLGHHGSCPSRCFAKNSPWSLSRRSEQSRSSGMSQPAPNHPESHQHSHSSAWLVLHCPWPLHPLGQPSKVQCLPFQPAKNTATLLQQYYLSRTNFGIFFNPSFQPLRIRIIPTQLENFRVLPFVQRQVPLEHMPWAEHLGSQVLTEQTSPCHPGSQTHRPDSQEPWGPQSKLHRSETKSRISFDPLL